MSGLPKNSQENIRTALENETLIVSLGAKLKIKELKFIRDWFLKHEIVNFGNPFEDLFFSKYLPEGFSDDYDIRKKVVDFVSSFDESIIDFEVEKLKDDDDDYEHITIKSVHRITESNDTISLPLYEESAGTLKMLALYPSFQEVMENGGVLFVDELNSRLHPLLVRSFLINFLDPKINKHHAQIIFTSHESWILSNNSLRRDEVWFTEKDENDVSSLYSLYDFVDEMGQKIRKDESYEKNYLLGKYGAIPDLKPMMVMEEDYGKGS